MTSPIDTSPIDVLVVAYGGADQLDGCLAGLDRRFPVTVLDNGCEEGTAEVTRRHDATYVAMRDNIGFGAACNHGFAQLALPQADVLLLNPDARIMPDDVAVLHRRLHEAPEIACVAPSQRRPGGERELRVLWPFGSARAAWLDALGLSSLARPDRSGFLVGSILLVKGAALVDVGGFDEAYFLYFEEEDWQRRAVSHGWRVAYCPEVHGTHEIGGTDSDPSRRALRFAAAAETYHRKWHGSAGWQSFRIARILGDLRRALLTRDPTQRRRLLIDATSFAAGPLRRARHTGVVPDRRHHVPPLQG